MLGCLVYMVRGSQGPGLRGDRGAQQEQDHCEPRLELHPSCQVALLYRKSVSWRNTTRMQLEGLHQGLGRGDMLSMAIGRVTPRDNLSVCM
jgi:hypothetical protein